MKNIVFILLGLGVIINAQNIVNTIGGDTATDKFIVENNASEAGLVVTGKGNVGIGTTSPIVQLQILGQSAKQVGLQYDGIDGSWASIYVNAETAGSTPGYGYLREGKLRAYTQCSSNYSWVLRTGEFMQHTLTVSGVDGSLDIPSEVIRKAKTGTANLVPIAYGSIANDGTINSGTGNFTCSWSGSNYLITITDENYSSSEYITLVTPIGNLGIPETRDSSNRLMIVIHDLAGNLIQRRFQFVTYKP